MSETQKQIDFQEEFYEMAAEESRRPACGAAATVYEALASEACLIPSRWEGLPLEYRRAFELAIAIAYEQGFAEGVKFAAAIKK